MPNDGASVPCNRLPQCFTDRCLQSKNTFDAMDLHRELQDIDIIKGYVSIRLPD